MHRIILILCLLMMTSCGTFRVGEEKVPDPVRKTKQHKEVEKQSAYYLATHTKDENKVVAEVLSRSIGTPKQKEEKANVLESELFRHIANFENENVQLNDKLEEFNGMSIAGTGYNLFPFFSGFGIVAIVALLILFPSATTILFFILRRTRTAMANVVEGIQEFSRDDPEHSKRLDELLERKLDRREKQQLKKF
jgi:hypothetical protein